MQFPVNFKLEIPIPKANESRENVKIRVMNHTRVVYCMAPHAAAAADS